jgi:transcriptional regulator with XRE-family HTH domain
MTPKTATVDDGVVGARITALRKARGLPQTALGQAVGVTFQQVQKYEKGMNRIGAGRLQEIAKFLNVPVSTLYGDETEAPERSGLFELLALPGATELLKTFAMIENPELRSNILSITSTAARMSMGPVAGNG